jgi:hypothetical protein
MAESSELKVSIERDVSYVLKIMMETTAAFSKQILHFTTRMLIICNESSKANRNEVERCPCA